MSSYTPSPASIFILPIDPRQAFFNRAGPARPDSPTLPRSHSSDSSQVAHRESDAVRPSTIVLGPHTPGELYIPLVPFASPVNAQELAERLEKLLLVQDASSDESDPDSSVSGTTVAGHGAELEFSLTRTDASMLSDMEISPITSPAGSTVGLASDATLNHVQQHPLVDTQNAYRPVQFSSKSLQDGSTSPYEAWMSVDWEGEYSISQESRDALDANPDGSHSPLLRILQAIEIEGMTDPWVHVHDPAGLRVDLDAIERIQYPVFGEFLYDDARLSFSDFIRSTPPPPPQEAPAPHGSSGCQPPLGSDFAPKPVQTTTTGAGPAGPAPMTDDIDRMELYRTGNFSWFGDVWCPWPPNYFPFTSGFPRYTYASACGKLSDAPDAYLEYVSGLEAREQFCRFGDGLA